MRTRAWGAALFAVALLTGCAAEPFPPGEGEWQTVSPEEIDSWGDDPAGGASMGACPWNPADVATPTPATASDDPRAVTEAIALPPDQFWMLVESIPDEPTDADFVLAASALAGCGVPAIVGFEARLSLALYDLDGESNHAWFTEHDPLRLGFVSDDTFLYARCATVLGGREIWERSVADETLEWADDSLHETGASELLLYVSWDAAGAHGLSVDEYADLLADVRLSYETASNRDRWPTLEMPDE